MSNGMPSMTALLGLLALAGYQNRDKISEMLKGGSPSAALPGSTTTAAPLGGLLRNLAERWGVPVPAVYSAEGSANCLISSSRAAMALPPNPGSIMALINRSHRLILNRQSVRIF